MKIKLEQFYNKICFVYKYLKGQTNVKIHFYIHPALSNPQDRENQYLRFSMNLVDIFHECDRIIPYFHQCKV